MPAPATITELLEIVVKSGVTDEARLKSYTQQLTEQGTMPSEPNKLAGQLVRDGHLTYFQAEQLLQGKWKRFTIGKYKVLERIGSGGMGQVFLCEHKFMRRRVAVKVLPTAKAEDPASLDRFYREARAVAAVDHPNIVRAYDIDQDDNLHFLVMEFVDGTNLQDLVKKVGPIDVIRACHYIYGSAVGLQHAHEVGLVHRDIKPGNVLVDRSGVVKILDMGLARFFHDEDDVLTKKYDEHVLGTADYLAPEQALESHSVDIRADIYSLGATFYFLLTGSALFPEGSVAQKLIWHQARVPRSIQLLRPEVPDEIVAIADKMMAKDAAHRYQTPAEVMEALAPWVTTPIPPPTERELPQLSPAAINASGQGIRATSTTSTTLTVHRSGGAAASPAATTFAGQSPATVAGSWSGAQPVGPAPSAPSSKPSLLMPSAPPLSPGGIWEGLSAETQNVEGSDTARPVLVTKPLSSRVLRKAPPKAASPRLAPRRVPTGALVGGAVAVAVGCAVLLYFFLLKSPRPDPIDPNVPPPSPVARAPRTITVSKGTGENVFGSLQRALSLARPGDTIEIAEPRIVETPVAFPLRLGGSNLKDVTIRSNLLGDAAAVIEFLPDVSSGKNAMIEFIHADGLTFQNVILNGNNSFATGVVINGPCPGVKLDKVTIRGVKTDVRLENAAGTAERPIRLERMNFVLDSTVETAIALMARPKQSVRHVLIEQCRFEGVSPPQAKPDAPLTPAPGTAIRVEGGTEAVRVAMNRIFNVAKGVSFGVLPDSTGQQLTLENNTFHTVKLALNFDVRSADAKGPYKVEVKQNYFAKTDVIARHAGPTGPLPGFVPEKTNARDQASHDGSLPVGALPVEAYVMPRPAPNAKDADFLRYGSDTPLGKGIDVAGKKVKVGFWTP